jgi:hypothetical protein
MSNDISTELEMHGVRERERERDSNMSSADNCLSADIGLRTTAFIWYIRNYYILIIGDDGKH